jgi:histidinol phosphatase-like PHP family hydrolase
MSDGQLAVAELAEVVRARGARPSVSDHLSRDVAGAVGSIDAVSDYLDELDRHDVLRGGEHCWHDSLWRELPPELLRRFTHRLGSLHAIWLEDGTLVRSFTSRVPELAVATYMDALVTNAEGLAREMQVDIMAHPTLVAIPLRARPPEELWTEALEERLVAALLRHGVAFEISARYRPHERLVRRAAAAGVRLSLGSDGHDRDHVGQLAAPLALARAIGVRDEDLYDPLVHGSKSRDS